MKKVWLVCSIAVLLALLSGCGGGGGGGPSTTTISGRVVDASNTQQGIAGATVALYPTKTRQAQPLASTKTDKDGYYTLTTNAGQYTLRVELPDGSYQAVELSIVASGTVKIDIRLVPRGIQIADVKITAPPADGPNGSYLVGNTYKFTATAYDSNGQPLNLQPNWCVTSSSGVIGTIDQEGYFTAEKEGTGTIWAIFTEDKKASVNITVTQLQGLTAQQVSRGFPLSVGSEWVYDPWEETEDIYTKVTDGTTVIEEKRTETSSGSDTHKVIGTQPPNPFPVETYVMLAKISGPWTHTYQKIVNGVPEAPHTDQGYSEDYDKSFYTNDKGEATAWGEQHWKPYPNISPPYTDPDSQGTWGQIEPYPLKWVMLLAGRTSWGASNIKMPMEIGDTGIQLEITFDFVAELKGLEKVDVPYGKSLDCYKVVYRFKNANVSVVSSGYQLLSGTYDWTFTAWYALDVGRVKAEANENLTVKLKENATGRILEAQYKHTQHWELKSCQIAKP
ncbi:carboxypeptidase regulatory-like domain-containing protein [bacterium]|nr:carboxypeptidase regulatory-like domain-containing protein [bacterium]